MAQQREWFRVVRAEAKADSGSATTTRATIHINDVIGASFFFGGVDAAELIREIDNLEVDAIDVRINSEGGSAYDGLAIANAIMRNQANTTTYVDGLAASAASLIALAGDRVVMSKYGQMMLHNSRGGLMGTADELRDYAKFLDGLNASMADFYADRAGGDARDWAKAMARETWYRADEALAAGLVTELDETTRREDVEAAVAAAMARPAAQFRYAGRQAAPAPTARADSTAVSAVNDRQKEAPVADKKTLAESLGLGADATDEDVLAAAREALGLTDDDSDTDPADGAAGSDGGEIAGATGDVVGAETRELAAAVASAQKAGGVFLPAERLARLEQQAGQGATALAAQVAAAHAAKLDAAITQGKILPTERDKYAALMTADEATTTALLEQIPAEARAPISELGHSLDPSPSASADFTTDPRFTHYNGGF